MRVSLGVAAVLATILAGCAARQTAPAATAQGPTPRTFVYVGTAGGDIQIFELDLGLGDLTARGKQSVGDTPVALAGDPEGRVLVAALARGTALSLAIDFKTGGLQPRGRMDTGGSDPARATMDATGKYALVTNRGSGNVSVLAIKPDRTLDTAETFASGKGPFGLTVHPGNQFAFVANLRAGTLSQFTFNAGTGRLTPKSGASTSGMPWDSGPRQVACHPNGRFTYVLNETNDTISVHAFDDRMASLSHMAFQVISTLPQGVTDKKNRAGDLQMDPRGLYLYASNVGHDSIASFAIDSTTGGLKLVDHQVTGGKGIEDLAVDPSGKYLIAANHKSKNITVFRLDDRTGVPGRLADVATPSAPRALHIARAMPEL